MILDNNFCEIFISKLLCLNFEFIIEIKTPAHKLFLFLGTFYCLTLNLKGKIS